MTNTPRSTLPGLSRNDGAPTQRAAHSPPHPNPLRPTGAERELGWWPKETCEYPGLAGGWRKGWQPHPTHRITILSVAYPHAPVGPDTSGGAEQILSALDHALVAAGHRSIVVARQGSSVAGELIPVPAGAGPIDDDARHRAQQEVRHAVAGAPAHDIVHLHGIDFAAYLPPPGRPCVVSLHLPPGWYPDHALHPTRPDTWLVCVSAAQRRACPPDPALLDPIPNGVPVDRLGLHRHARRSFALMLGRICPEKGQHLALRAAHLAHAPLLLAGELFPYEWHRLYFTTKVAPRLDAMRRWLGPIGFARKRRLLSAARCLLAPSLAPETASLVAMEALACGTPVIAFPAGALAEVVEDGRTGFLVHTPEEMAAAIAHAGEIDPETCRKTARKRFAQQCMTDAYLRLYTQLARNRAAA